jgi:hypothetical protein
MHSVQDEELRVQDKTAGADDEGEYEDFLGAPPPDEVPALEPQVPSYIAIIRIVAVLAMGLSISFGIFVMLTGLRGLVIGSFIVLLAIPAYLGMQLAEKIVAGREEQSPAAE